MTASFADAFDEPSGATARGTVIVVPGRGETAAAYQRLGNRLAADGYRVRVVEADLGDAGGLERTRTRIEKLLADETLPSPLVLLGADAGASLLARTGAELAVDALVLAGIALPGSAPADVADEIDARSACPVHRGVLERDAGFHLGALARPLPWPEVVPATGRLPVLLLHGTADVVTPVAEAVALADRVAGARVRLVEGGRHDVLNDVAHRSVAATLVLFLESLRQGPTLPAVVR